VTREMNVNLSTFLIPLNVSPRWNVISMFVSFVGCSVWVLASPHHQVHQPSIPSRALDRKLMSFHFLQVPHNEDEIMMCSV